MKLGCIRLGRAALWIAVPLALVSGSAFAQGQMPCMNEVGTLRNDVEKQAMAVKGSIDRKAERAEVCNGMKRFAASEAKFVKYLETNASWCGIPAEAIKQVKANHANTLKMRGQACSTASAPRQGPPPGPGLSEALGTSRSMAPPSDDGKSDRGTYNTLTGNPLQR